MLRFLKAKFLNLEYIVQNNYCRFGITALLKHAKLFRRKVLLEKVLEQKRLSRQKMAFKSMEHRPRVTNLTIVKTEAPSIKNVDESDLN
jgi:hypothetical protein